MIEMTNISPFFQEQSESLGLCVRLSPGFIATDRGRNARSGCLKLNDRSMSATAFNMQLQGP